MAVVCCGELTKVLLEYIAYMQLHCYSPYEMDWSGWVEDLLRVWFIPGSCIHFNQGFAS